LQDKINCIDNKLLQKGQNNMINQNLETTISALRNFSEPNRLAIISLLSTGPMLVGDICNASGLPLTLVSQHLRVLRESGMVRAERDGKDARAVWYSLNPQRIKEIQKALSMVFDMTKIVDRRIPEAKQGLNFKGEKFSVLFLCSGNSARSQMSEALLQHYGKGLIEGRSAGTHPRKVHPLTVKVLEEIGLDTTGLKTKHYSVFSRESFRYVITVCDRANEECPDFKGDYQRIHWSIADPVKDGNEDELVNVFKQTRQELAERIELFVHAHCYEAERLSGRSNNIYAKGDKK
jgi:ArsR family transcriptional regulator, arsenate/arsenite/antimonite-responsive transcriptional repressor / arsenate reductase (thioredoxin)